MSLAIANGMNPKQHWEKKRLREKSCHSAVINNSSVTSKSAFPFRLTAPSSPPPPPLCVFPCHMIQMMREWMVCWSNICLFQFFDSFPNRFCWNKKDKTVSEVFLVLKSPDFDGEILSRSLSTIWASGHLSSQTKAFISKSCNKEDGKGEGGEGVRGVYDYQLLTADQYQEISKHTSSAGSHDALIAVKVWRCDTR